MDIEKVEFNGEDIKDDVVQDAVETVEAVAEDRSADVVALPTHSDYHANDATEDVERELTDEEYVNQAFPLPEDFPSKDQIDAWRKRYGRIRIRRMGPGEAYIIRPLQRGEVYKYEELQSQAENEEGFARTKMNLEIEEAIVSLCMLYPQASQEQLHGSDPNFEHPVLVAGTIGFLALDILVSSNMLGESPTVVEDL